MGKERSSFFVFAVMSILALSGCGKYAPPLPPESFAPEPVQYLTLVPTDSALTLAWEAPVKDVRGKSLRSLDGYQIERRVLNADEDGKPSGVEQPIASVPPFEVRGFVEDRSYAALVAEKERLRSEQRPSHRARIAPELKRYSFDDRELAIGTSYLYRIVALNQGGVAGNPSTVYRVVFQGAQSQIAPLGSRVSAFDLFEASSAIN